ncbi:MAG: hypothetical protein H0Z35_12405 [Thermoanaerobacteraceae bacterium]|nr:hypothetical protein [Thermoanaerobacteraceae bacterium]
MKVITLKSVRLNGNDEPAGKELEIDNYLAKKWFEMELARPVGSEAEQNQMEKISEEQEQYPKHTGGGWYELSNGEKVKGKEEAIKAQAALNEQ